jgi:hypothetical protein
VLVLTIAIPIGENVGRGMGLVSADTEGDPNVSEFCGDIIVDKEDFFFLRGRASRKFVSLCLDFRRRSYAGSLELLIPLADLFPTVEGSDLHVGNCVLGGFCGFGFLVFRWTFEISGLPKVNPITVFVCGRGNDLGALDLHVTVTGHANFKLLVQNDSVFEEIPLEPKLSRD